MEQTAIPLTFGQRPNQILVSISREEIEEAELIAGSSPSTDEAPEELDLVVAEKSGELEKKEKLPVVACKIPVGSSDGVCRSELRRKQRLGVLGLFHLLATPPVLKYSLALDLPLRGDRSLVVHCGVPVLRD
ncbi:hypothetical protein U1Q18_027821 [Sarracenia purpurea var. burkii]